MKEYIWFLIYVAVKRYNAPTIYWNGYEMTTILLINPPRIRPDMAVLRDEICFQDVRYVPFPLRIAQLAAVLRQRFPNADISLLDANALNLNYNMLEDSIPEADVVIFQSAAGIIKEDCTVASIVKKINPATKTVLIETVISPIFAERFLADFPAVDIVVQGQPEVVVPNLIDNLSDLSKAKGITYRTKTGCAHTGTAPFIQDMDALPFMAYDMLPMEKYSIGVLDTPMHEKIIPGIRMRTTRDCPYGCPFCIIGSHPHRGYDRKWKAMSPKRVVDEIEFAIREWGIWGFFFWDETYTYDMDRARAISEEIIKRRLRLEWRCLTRLDKVDKSLLELMSRSGCRQIEYGLESGDPEHRKQLHKNFPDSVAIDAVCQTRKAGIKVNVDMIIGMPWENRHSLRKTLELAKKLNADNIHLTMAFPYPATKFFELVKEENLLEIDDIYDLMIKQRVRIGAKAFVRTRHLSSKELEEGWKRVRSGINKYYMIRKLVCEPASFFPLFSSCRNPGEVFHVLGNGARRVARTLFPGE